MVKSLQINRFAHSYQTVKIKRVKRAQVLCSQSLIEVFHGTATEYIKITKNNINNIQCVSKKFTLFLFTITKSDVDQFK